MLLATGVLLLARSLLAPAERAASRWSAQFPDSVAAAQALHLLHRHCICCTDCICCCTGIAHLLYRHYICCTGIASVAQALYICCTGTVYLLHRHCICCTGTAYLGQALYLLHSCTGAVSAAQALYICCTGTVSAVQALYICCTGTTSAAQRSRSLFETTVRTCCSQIHCALCLFSLLSCLRAWICTGTH